MDTVTSVNGILIRLNAERWSHIITGHPEIADYNSEILQAIELPEIIYEGNRGELLAVRSVQISNDKKVVVVYKEVSVADGFIITAYLSNKLDELQKRKIVWQRPN